MFLSIYHSLSMFFFFFFNDTATTEIYTLSLHDALPICAGNIARQTGCRRRSARVRSRRRRSYPRRLETAEHWRAFLPKERFLRADLRGAARLYREPRQTEPDPKRIRHRRRRRGSDLERQKCS